MGKRTVYIDALRIFAIIGVVINHTYMRLVTPDMGNTAFTLAMAPLFIGKPAVIIFVMICGVTLMPKCEDFPATLKRVLRMAVILAVFSFLYCLNSKIHAGGMEPFSVSEWLSCLFTGNIPDAYAYWFFYMYIGILLMMPLLAKLNSCMERRDYLYFFALAAVPCLVISLRKFMPFLDGHAAYSAVLFTGYAALPFLGFCIDRYAEMTGKKTALCLAGAAALIALETVLTGAAHAEDPGYYRYFDNNLSFFNVAAAALIFAAFKYLFRESGSRAIPYLGSLVFGVFLLSDFFILRTGDLFMNLAPYTGRFAAVLIFQTAVIALSMLCAAVLKKIPGIGKYF